MNGMETMFFALASVLIIILIIAVFVKASKKDEPVQQQSEPETIIDQVIEVPRRTYDYVDRGFIRPVRRFARPYISRFY